MFPLPEPTQAAPNQSSIGAPTSLRSAGSDIVTMSACHMQNALYGIWAARK